MTDLAESLDILKDFPPVPTKAWEASIHVDLKREDYNKKLVWNSDEGIEVCPYYRSEDIKDSMTDFFLILMIPGAGDKLQGIKRGIVEMVDGIVINKADGENVCAARRARSQYESALRMFAPNRQGWTARVLTCSGLENRGIREVWQMILDHRARQEAGGHLERRRQAQALSWMRELISSGLQEIFQNASAVQERLA